MAPMKTPMTISPTMSTKPLNTPDGIGGSVSATTGVTTTLSASAIIRRMRGLTKLSANPGSSIIAAPMRQNTSAIE